MSYQIKIDPKSRKAARFISKLQKVIQKALVESGKTQQDVAERLGVDRSVVNRRLKGSSNITARSIAEFAYALDKEIVFKFIDKETTRKVNWATETNNLVNFPEKSNVSLTRGTIEQFNKANFERTAS